MGGNASGQSGNQNTNSNQQGNQNQSYQPGYAPGQQDFINNLNSLFTSGFAGLGQSLFQGGQLPGFWNGLQNGISSSDANNIAGEAVRIANPQFNQGGLQDSGVKDVALSRVAGDVLRNVAQFNVMNKSNLLSGAMGMGQNLTALLSGQYQGQQPYTASGNFNQNGNQNTRQNQWGWGFNW